MAWPDDRGRHPSDHPADVDEGHQGRRHLRRPRRQLGLRAFLIEGTLRDLEHELSRGRPVLVGLVKPHGKQDAAATTRWWSRSIPAERKVVTLDPAAGWRENSYEGFVAEWEPAQRTTLVVLPGAGSADRGRGATSRGGTP